VYYLLIVAYYLSILTFYLGALIYLLPIPLTGLKRWGPRLISDSLFILVLSISIGTIFSFADFLRAVLGGDWQHFLQFLKGLIVQNTFTLVILSQAQYILSKFGLSKVLGVITQTISYSLYVLLMFYILALVIKSVYGVMASLGIALMAIPFRIARTAGAFLLAFSIVFYIALPLYPGFVDLLLTGYTYLHQNSVIIYGRVVNEDGIVLSSGFLTLKLESYTNKNSISLIPITHGVFYIFDLPRNISLDSKVTIFYDATGHLFYTNITNMSLHQLCNISAKSPHFQLCEVSVLVRGVLHYSNGITLHIHPWPEKEYVVYNPYDNTIRASITCTNCRLYISYVNSKTPDTICIDDQCRDVRELVKYCWQWYILNGCTAVIDISGNHTVIVKLSDTSLEPMLTLSMISKLRSVPHISPLEFIARLIYVQLISSILYLALLLSITLGLARLLGGTSRFRVI